MPTAPYPLLSDALNHVRVAVNDAIANIGGNTFTNDADFTPYYVNRGWQMFQQDLLSMGYVRLLVTNFIMLAVPTVASEDTSLQCWLDWTGFYDGVTLQSAPVFPQDCIKPVKFSERVSGDAPNLSLFWDMSGPEQGVTRVPSITKDYRNRIWTWDQDKAWFPGTVSAVDLRMDYAAFLPDFTGSGSGFPGSQVIPIMRSTDALAWYIAYIISKARNDDPMVYQFCISEARRAASIIAGQKPPAETMAAPVVTQ